MPEAIRNRLLQTRPHLRIVTAEDGECLEYLFKPSRRCRTRIILRYDARQDMPVLTAPYGVADLEQADEFVLQQRENVRRLRVLARSDWNAAYDIEGGSGYILYRGRKTAVAVDATAKTSYVDVTGDDAVIRLALPQTCSREEVDRALLALFKAQAKTVLGDLMEAYRGSARRWPVSWRLSSARTRWGCCTARDTIRLSWRLIFLDDGLASYVIAHELAHLVHLNHSKAFWKEVERLCPDWRAQRARLKATGELPDLEAVGQ